MISLSSLGLLAIKSIVIIGLAWLAYFSTQRQTAKVRYFTVQLFFIILVFLPFGTYLFPEWHWSYTNSLIHQAPSDFDETFTLTNFTSSEAVVAPEKACQSTAPNAIIEALPSGTGEPEVTATTSMPWNTLLYWAWILTSLVLLFQLGKELWQLWQLKISPKGPRNHPVFVHLWTSLSAVKQLPTPQFLLDSSVQVPFTFGHLRPIIVLPEEAIGWPEERLKAVLLHEAAHIKHQDYLPNIIRRLACCLFWWNFPIWALAKKIQLESEKRADQWVIKHEISPFDYAAQLVQITRLLQSPKYAMVSSIGHANQLRNRVEHVIKEKSPQPLRLGILCLFTLFSLGCLTILSACFQAEASSSLSSHLALKQKVHAPIDQLTPLIWQAGEEENKEAVPLLQELLSHDSTQIRSLAAWALGEIKDQNSFASLRHLLTDEDVWVQEMAIRSIGELEVSSSLDLIDPFLQAAHLHLRLAAVQAIADVGVPRGTSLLWNAIRTWPEDQRAQAIQKIGEYGNYCAVPLLSKLLSEEPTTKLDVVVGLGKLRAKESLSTLLPLLSDKDPTIRAATAKSLGLIGDAKAIHHLIPMLRDENSEVREVTVWALDEIGV
ncbi:MAG: hypothetical protein F6K19_04735 [Cyanothece sp. SIO1E1]|nr:hypothetical protein [Cyanothece sp. SIO1E1]